MAYEYGLISQINTKKSNDWNKKIYLTFDIDWAHDEIIQDVILILEEYSASATFFATHKSKFLDNYFGKRENFEIGIHPNFNPLLNGMSDGKNFHKICCELKEHFPNATAVRSHSLCFGSLIQTSYERLGITHDSSIMIPYQNNDTPIFPWKMWDNLIRVPYFFCDYVTAMTTSSSMEKLVFRNGLKVFDFHPIHVFLNTEKLSRYEQTRTIHHNPRELIKHRFNGYGARNRLIDLLKLMSIP